MAHAVATEKEPSGWIGWIYFAGALMLIIGFFQIFLGLMAVFNDTLFVVGQNQVLLVDFTTWGWVHMLIGVLTLTAAFSVFKGGWYGRIYGSIMAAISLFANLAFLPAYPIWSLVALAIDGFILYALLVRGGEMKLP